MTKTNNLGKKRFKYDLSDSDDFDDSEYSLSDSSSIKPTNKKKQLKKSKNNTFIYKSNNNYKNIIKNIKEIKTIDDLISLGNSYHNTKNTKFFNLDLKILHRLINPLTKLNNMVGLKEIKENIIDQILFFLQELHIKYDIDTSGKIDKITDILHIVITGPPGVGKTEVGKILGQIYKEMGILSNGTFNLVTRSDLIAKYLGQTAIKTQNTINKCLGGVMFIDEAYALGSNDGSDSYSKECIDTLNQNLTENKDLLCIIAGYKDSLDKSFFNMNDGLKRRFAFRYNIDSYTHIELQQIFENKLYNDKWSLEFKDTNNTNDIKEFTNFFKLNIKHFPNFGGDIETLILKCKIAHSKRILFLHEKFKKKLNLSDIYNGFNNFISSQIII
jgi:hypothetical protein